MQLMWFRKTMGRLPSHVDGHQHVHVLPGVVSNKLFRPTFHGEMQMHAKTGQTLSHYDPHRSHCRNLYGHVTRVSPAWSLAHSPATRLGHACIRRHRNRTAWPAPACTAHAHICSLVGCTGKRPVSVFRVLRRGARACRIRETCCTHHLGIRRPVLYGSQLLCAGALGGR